MKSAHFNVGRFSYARGGWLDPIEKFFETTKLDRILAFYDEHLVQQGLQDLFEYFYGAATNAAWPPSEDALLDYVCDKLHNMFHIIIKRVHPRKKGKLRYQFHGFLESIRRRAQVERLRMLHEMFFGWPRGTEYASDRRRYQSRRGGQGQNYATHYNVVSHSSFAVLGLSPSATEAELKSRYRQLAKRHHPDVGGDEEKFKNISAAYQKCLSRFS